MHARHILVRQRGRGQSDRSSSSRAAPTSPAVAEGEVEGPGCRRRRRPRLFHQGQMVPEFADVAFKMYPGQLSEPGEDPVRLARHQGRGPARSAGADLRPGQGPDRRLCGPQGAKPSTSTGLRKTAKVERLQPSLPPEPPPPRPDRAEGAAPKPSRTGKITPSAPMRRRLTPANGTPAMPRASAPPHMRRRPRTCAGQ